MTQGKTAPKEPQHSIAEELDANAILVAEFHYARETAAQAMDDRHKMVQFYVISIFIPFLTAVIGLIAIGAKSVELIQMPLFRYALTGAFILLFIMGLLFLLKLIRLRVAWFQSAKCMNKIKHYYSVHLKDFVFDKARKPEDVVVGEGNLDLNKTFTTLKNINFQGRLILEYEGDPADPIPALKQCVEAVNKVEV